MGDSSSNFTLDVVKVERSFETDAASGYMHEDFIKTEDQVMTNDCLPSVPSVSYTCQYGNSNANGKTSSTEAYLLHKRKWEASSDTESDMPSSPIVKVENLSEDSGDNSYTSEWDKSVKLETITGNDAPCHASTLVHGGNQRMGTCSDESQNNSGTTYQKEGIVHCTRCNTIFKTKASLDRHVYRFHNDEYWRRRIRERSHTGVGELPAAIDMCNSGTENMTSGDDDVNRDSLTCRARNVDGKKSAKRRCLPFSTKLSIIEEVERKQKTKAMICREFRIVSSSLETILKHKEKIRAAINEGSAKRKKKYSMAYKDVDKALFIWFKQARANGVQLSARVLIDKGEELARALGYSNFEISRGWVDRFKARHGIFMKVASSEAASSSKRINTNTDCWMMKLQSILHAYQPCDIFNADETGLFYKSLPNDKPLAMQGQACTGQKAPKDRLTLLCGANMDGSEKLPLLAIGEFERPMCFKNIQTLPVTYRSNRKAWITSGLFQEWLRTLDRLFLMEGRKIALIVDDCTAHSYVSDLRAINLYIIPPHTTGQLQPCDQGIIKTMKTIYRKNLLSRFINTYEESGSTDPHFNLSLLDALCMAASSWNEVDRNTIAKCFLHAGFHNNLFLNVDTVRTSESDSVVCVGDGHTDNPCDIDRDEQFANLFERMNSLMNVELSADEYINIDQFIDTASEIVTRNWSSINDSNIGCEEEKEEAGDAIPQVTERTVLESLDTVRKFIMQHSDSHNALDYLAKVERKVQVMLQLQDL